MALTCDECGARLKITITGGEFLVSDGSTIDNINFNSVADVIHDALGVAPEEKEDDILVVDVCCTIDPTHMVMGSSISRIKCEIYQRLRAASERLIRKYCS